MAGTNFPGAIDTNDSLVNSRLAGNFIPASDHNDLTNALIAVQTKMGIGVAQPTSTGQVFTATAPGVTGWATPAQTTITNVTNVTRSISQNAHGFQVGNIVTILNGIYSLARADTASNSEVVGIVSAVSNTNTFTLLTEGYITGLSTLTSGTVYFLSPSSYGSITSVEPSATGQISKPILIADGNNSGYFHNFRGVVIGNTTSGGSTSSGASSILSVRQVTSNTVMTNTDDVLYVTSGGVTITLQVSNSATSKAFRINNSSTSKITITAASGNTVDGISTFQLLADSTIELVPFLTNWIVT